MSPTGLLKRETLQRVRSTMFGGLPKDRLTQDLMNAVDYLQAQDFVQSGKIASVGFCFGGGMSINLAFHAKLAACVYLATMERKICASTRISMNWSKL